MTYIIRLTEDQFARVIGDLEVIEADTLAAGPVRDRAQRIRETLWQETEHPAQQVAERAETLGDDYDREPF